MKKKTTKTKKLYIATPNTDISISDISDDGVIFATYNDAVEYLKNDWDNYYIVEVEIKSINANFPPKEEGKMYTVSVDKL